MQNIPRKFEFHFPIWDKDLITYAGGQTFWKRFEYEGKTYIKTFQCLVEVKKMTIDKFLKIQSTLDWYGPEEFRIKIKATKMIPSDYAASNGGRRFNG